MSNSYVFDIEGNGLSPTKIWCLSYCKAGTNNVISLTNYDDMKNFLLQDNISLIAHNCVSFDIPVLERILGIKISARIVDTLGLSWYLSPKRVKHGLESYGEEYGVPKPVVKEEEWLGLSEEELERIDYLKSNSPDSEELSILEKKKKDHLSLMIHRCSEDVKINSRLYSEQMKKLGMLYDDMDGIYRLVNYIYFKLSCAREQEEVKWKLDLDKVNSGLEELESIKQEKVEALRLAMPKNLIYKEKKRPKVYTKKDGSKSKKALEWESFCEENGINIDEPSHKYVEDYETGNPGSSSQIKNWLYSLGWKPETFSFVREKESFGTRKIPQVNIPNGGGICPSIKKLYDKEPNLELLEGLSVISHRISILKGFLRAVDDNGYVYAGISGLTNTMRFKHSICVNLPGVDKPYGKLIRGCLIAPEGYELCGSDLCSLEDRTKQHFMWEYDPEYVKEMIKPGFDPHLDLALAANALTPEQIENHKSGNEDHSKVRKVYKSANYALTNHY
jgi:hypothetical protein